MEWILGYYELENSGIKSRFLFCLIFQFYCLMYRLICQKPVHFLSAQMTLVSTCFQMFIVLGMYNLAKKAGRRKAKKKDEGMLLQTSFLSWPLSPYSYSILFVWRRKRRKSIWTSVHKNKWEPVWKPAWFFFFQTCSKSYTSDIFSVSSWKKNFCLFSSKLFFHRSSTKLLTRAGLAEPEG